MIKKPLNKIISIEDEEDIRTILKVSLEDIGGFYVRFFSSGIEALEHVQSFNADLILLDMMMPGIDGVETFKRIRLVNSLNQIPIIFMTAKAQKNEIDQYLKLGALDVILKPFDAMLLPEKLNSLWNSYEYKA